MTLQKETGITVQMRTGAGKPIVSGNIVKAAQEQGIFAVLIDSENAIDEKWLHALDVDTSEETTR